MDDERFQRILVELKNGMQHAVGNNLVEEELSNRLRVIIRRIHRDEPTEAQTVARSSEPTTRSERPAVQVPRFAEQLACLLVTRADADVLVGDLEEQFQRYAIRYGQRYSTFWYWWQVGSLISSRARNMLLWLCGLAGLRKAFEWIGKLGGS